MNTIYDTISYTTKNMVVRNPGKFELSSYFIILHTLGTAANKHTWI